MSATFIRAATCRWWSGRSRGSAPAIRRCGTLRSCSSASTAAPPRRSRLLASGAPGTEPLLVLKGATPEPDLIELYRGAAALVYPSRYEGFGLPLLEAMSCGTPVIAARSSSIPEVVGDAGALLDPDDEAAWTDAIERAIDDPAWARSLAEAGAARASLFSWTRSANETLRVYRSLLEPAA